MAGAEVEAEDATGDEAPARPKPARSPLTDPRSLVAAAIVHAVVVALAWSLAARPSSDGSDAEPPRVMTADLAPVDDRAASTPVGGEPSPDGGGGEVVSKSARAAIAGADGRSADGAAPRNAAGDAIVDRILPGAGPTPPTPPVPGAIETAIGLPGGVAGAGGGAGSGVGAGRGPATEFFGAREQATTFAYVIDCSGSMSEHRALDLAKGELIASLRRLPPDAKFGVVFYNLRTIELADARGVPGLMPATAENKDHVAGRLRAIKSEGGTDHLTAIRAALALKPEVVFFLTDAARLTPDEVEAMTTEAGPARIQAIEFGVGPSLGVAVPLRNLAAATHGQYRYVDVTASASRP